MSLRPASRLKPPRRAVPAATFMSSLAPGLAPRPALKLALAVALFAGLVFAPVAPVAQAHTRSRSFSSWSVSDADVSVLFTVSAFEATRLERVAGDRRADVERLAAHLRSELRVSRAGAHCNETGAPRTLDPRSGYVRVEIDYRCPPGSGKLEVVVGAFFEAAPSHVHIARVRSGDARPFERVLSAKNRAFALAGDTSAAMSGVSAGVGTDSPRTARTAWTASAVSGLFDYLGLGVEHILAGLDHLAFLLALLLLCRSVREVVLLVTGFTLGHSVTLALGVLGAVRPNEAMVEAMIGFTIALVAIENLSSDSGRAARFGATAAMGLVALAISRSFMMFGPPLPMLLGLALFAGCYLTLAATREQSARFRPALTLVFGLVHGFGFAGVLQEIGLPTGRRLAALLGFNLGVELGQLAVVLAAAGAGLGVRTLVGRRSSALLADFGSAALAGIGLFWFFSRAYA